ncbi:ALBINO3-like protein 1, chloroplastic [Rhododendron vialii]|uniref:ALBINO3-like protein 1, chloroplastic n=1 Tax=Rhododendron vialii TaxID=182163 RepID=UPI00265F317E|nr:ALBINO3-like protein 1, chloroplastic [Rhododendron vialii]
MSSFLSIAPNSPPSLFPNRTRPTNPLLHRTHNVGLSNQRRTLCASGFGHVPFPDPDSAKGLIKDLFGRANGFLYPIANAAVSSNSDAVTGSKQGGDWLSGVVIDMGGVLKVLKDGLSAVHVPYAYGFAIILLAVLVKVATFPLTKNQIKSTVAMRSLQPQIKVIQQRYAGDQERIQLETDRLYKLAGFNPLGGCLPILATVPIWIGIYRALANVADEGLLTEGFFWIPSLAGPTAIATRQGGSAISWLFPFVDGHPLLGWPDTLAYLVLPVLLVLAQYTIVRIMQSSQANDPSLKSSQSITKFLPLLFGFLALLVPSGLSLYWFTNTVLSTAQQVWLKNSWVAENSMSKLTDTIIEEEPPLVQTPIFLTSTTEKEPRAEMLPPQGPRPGERFRKIKEQEEKRRQQREEEKNKGEEAAVDATQPNGAYGKETILGQGESGNEAETRVSSHGSGDSMTGINDASSTGNHVVNGNLSMSDSKEDQKTILEMESSEQSSNCKDGRGDQSLHGNPDKEEAVAAIGKPDYELSGEDMAQDRSE